MSDGFETWLRSDPAPDLEELVERYDGYDKDFRECR
jgi:hypothetical protein